MNVTSAVLRPWHIPTVVGTFVLANVPRVDVLTYQGRHTPALVAAGTALPGVMSDLKAVGVWAGTSLQGFGVLRCTTATRRASLQALTVLDSRTLNPADGSPGSQQLATAGAILDRLAVCAGAAGRTNLVARVWEDSPYTEAFTEHGFAKAAIEYEYERPPGPIGEPPVIERLRRQEPPDSWDVMHLYRGTTPAAVQRMAARNMEELERGLPRKLWFRPGGTRGGERMLVDDDHGLAARLEVRLEAGDAHHLMLMVHPRSYHLIEALIRWALWRIRSAPSRPTRIRVLESQPAIGKILETIGFTHTTTDALMVKDIAQCVAAGGHRVAFDGVIG